MGVDLVARASIQTMSVQLQPSSNLGFQRPLTQTVKRTLSVSNSNSQPVAFKVKTTAPKQYCVRPNSGRIEPGETVDVQVLLQPMKEDPPIGAKCRDKFLVQSAIITPDRETATLAEFWSITEKDKSFISEQKIRCVFLPKPTETLAESPHEVDGSPAPGNESFEVTPVTPSKGATPQTNGIGASVAGAGTAAGSAALAGAQGKDSGAELANARGEIERLKAELSAAGSGLRQRAAPAAEKAHGAALEVKQKAEASGMSLSTVVALVLLVFLLTWWFF